MNTSVRYTYHQKRAYSHIKMNCDYYIDEYLVIEYISEKGRYCRLTTDLSRRQKYIRDKFEDESDNELTEVESSSHERRLERKLEKHTYRQMIYQNKAWVNNDYRTQYTSRLQREFPYVHKLKKMYIDFTAFKAEEY
jgi:hypothetical protein